MTTTNPLHIDPLHAIQKISEFITDELHSAGKENFVIGLSGGVDSALSAFLAVKAIGKEHVYGVRMPYRTSSKASLVDAERVVAILGIRHETVDITEPVEAVIKRDPTMDHVRRGNIMARMRMITLYDISAREKAIVLGTGNKTEILLGYTTLFGDSACGINPIGDLYKTQVWQLSEYLGVPKEILQKAPSADLWDGQTDESELDMKYKDVDILFYWMVDKKLSDEELVTKGFDITFIHRVRERMRRNEFKRMSVPIARIN